MKKYLLIIPFVFIGCSDTKIKLPTLDLDDTSTKNMVEIKGGDYIIGTTNDTYGDKNLKSITLSSFYIDKTEVTNKEYKKYLAKNPNIKRPSHIDDETKGADNLPVVNVSYIDAKNYCDSIKKTLPTEAQWEVASKGGFNTSYPWGANFDKTFANSRETKLYSSKPVMSYQPNAYGVYDMVGNVREWVKDSYQKDFYKTIKDKNPVNESKEFNKVTRGGSWKYSDGYPADTVSRSFDNMFKSYDDLGFRCAYTKKFNF
jgi:formylglycine-generating enzyme required for sulfatase activity